MSEELDGKLRRTVTVMRRQWAAPDANGFSKELAPVEAKVVIEIDVRELAQRLSHRVWGSRAKKATTNEGLVIVTPAGA